MFDDAKFQIDFVNELSFNRYGGTEDELRAAKLIQSKIEALGGKSELFEFEVPAYSVTEAKFEILTPYRKEITVNGVGCTGSTPEGGLTAPFCYVEGGDEVDCLKADVKGKIVLINGTGYVAYKRLLDMGAAGFVVFSGAFNDDESRTDLDRRQLRDFLTEEGTIPGVCMRCADAIHLMENPPETVKMTLKGESFPNISRDVVAEIVGSERPDEWLVMTAHYDSTIFGCGAWDNATGAANILEMYRYYLENRPGRSIRFIWCGSEEQGLLGSTAWAEAHPDEVAKTIFCMNFDMTGPTVGRNLTLVTGGDDLKYYLHGVARTLGYTTRWQDASVHSSDSVPFCYRGVPAVGIARDGQATGHNRNDVPWPLSGEKLKEATDFAKAVAAPVLSGYQPPFERKMPPDMMEKLENYLRRGKPKEEKK